MFDDSMQSDWKVPATDEHISKHQKTLRNRITVLCSPVEVITKTIIGQSSIVSLKNEKRQIAIFTETQQPSKGLQTKERFEKDLDELDANPDIIIVFSRSHPANLANTGSAKEN